MSDTDDKGSDADLVAILTGHTDGTPHKGACAPRAVRNRDGPPPRPRDNVEDRYVRTMEGEELAYYAAGWNDPRLVRREAEVRAAIADTGIVREKGPPMGRDR